MSGESASIDLDFADGRYTFALPLVRIKELQAKCGAPGPPVGVGLIFNRLLKGCLEIKGQIIMAPAAAEFHVEDIVETLRQGLIGGATGLVDGQQIAVTPIIAERLIQSYVVDRPLRHSWSLAVSILGATVMGYDPPKKDLPAAARATDEATASSTSA